MRLATAEPDLEQRDALVMAHVGLVKTMARRLAQRLPSQVDVGDLIGVGMVGLIEAAQRYRPSTGVPFSAFARRRLHGAMLDVLRGLDWAPRSLRRLRRDLDGSIVRLRHQLGREPSEKEIADALGLNAEQFAHVLDQVRRLDVATVRQTDREGDERSIMELCVDTGLGADVRLERAELRQHLAAAISQLPKREQQILFMYYGRELTLAEVGAVIGLTESRVSQLRALAVSRVRATLQASLRLEGAA